MASSQKCPTCGRDIPSEAPGGLCPFCAFDVGVEPEDSPVSDSAVRSTSSMLDSQFLSSRRGWWTLALLTAVVTVVSLIRLGSSEFKLRPSLKFDSEHRVALDQYQYGVDETDTLIRVNGMPINDRSELTRAYDAVSGNSIEFVFAASAGERRVTWIRSSSNPAFTASASTGVVPGDPFEDLGLGEGETIIAVNGRPLATLTRNVSGDSLRRGFSGIRTRFSVSSGDSPNAREIVVMKYDSASYWGRFVTGLAFGVLGILGCRLRPKSRAVKAFAFFCLFVMVTWYSRSVSFYSRTGVENALYSFLQCMLPAASVLFMLTYTPFRQLVLRPDRWIGVAILYGLLLIVVNFIWNTNSALVGLLHRPLFILWSGTLLGIVVLALTSPLWVRMAKTPLSSVDRSRYFVLWIAIALSFLPGSLNLFIRFSSLGPTTYSLGSELVVLVFPVIILYAIIRHNILNLNELVREGTLYGLLLAGITLGYSGMAALVTALLDTAINADSPVVETGMVAGLFAIAIPVHNVARSALNRRFSRVPAEYQTLLDSLIKSALTQTTHFEYCEFLVENIQSVTAARSVTILTNFEELGGWSVGAMAPSPRTEQTTERCGALLDLLEPSGKPVFLEDLFEHEIEPENLEAAIAGMYTFECEVAYPLVAYKRVIGALLIGGKRGGRTYRASELKSLNTISQQAAQHLLNLLGRRTLMEGQSIADMFPQFPVHIGPYTIESIIGQGGMANVYRGVNGPNEAAIKVANRMVQSDPTLMERFHREAAAIQRVDSAYVARVFEVGWHGREPYIALEYCAKGSAINLIDPDDPMAERVVLRAIRDVAKGLRAALAEGIVHRDIKPGNILIKEDGSAVVGDFGLARISDRTPITKTGDLFGTPEYMSPELAKGAAGDWRTDQYALGVTLYQLLSGDTPFRGANFEAVLYQHINAPIPSLPAIVRKRVSHLTLTIIQRMLAKEPGRRYPSYDSLIDNLDRVLIDIEPRATDS